MSSRIFNLKRLELVLLGAGIALIAIAAVTYFGGKLYSRGAVARFHSTSTSPLPADPAHARLRNVTEVNFSLWSPKRVEEYKDSLPQHFDEPLAVLVVKKIHLEVPVFEGTSDPVLNRGVGRILGTAAIGGSGNIGIAGHRDGFFRGLKDVGVGDSIELETTAGNQVYVIDSITIVNKDDVSVLRNEPGTALTLVTCYPFYFIGSAPQRYIVHASLTGETTTLDKPAKASMQATASKIKETTQ